jgi:hypothetical protein
MVAEATQHYSDADGAGPPRDGPCAPWSLEVLEEIPRGGRSAIRKGRHTDVG